MNLRYLAKCIHIFEIRIETCSFEIFKSLFTAGFMCHAVKSFKRLSGAKHAVLHKSCQFKDCMIWPNTPVNIFTV